MSSHQTPPGEAPRDGADALRERFGSVSPHTVGLEEELMLLDPETRHLAPRAEAMLAVLAADPRFKRELPAAQIEIALPPAASVPAAVAALGAARQDLVAVLDGELAVAASGVHPASPGAGELNDHPRYSHTRAEFGPVARRQLVFALQVHVAVGDADRALAVYNAVRSYLPLIAALGANAPFYEGRDSGLASVRPKLCELLPRQGIPPVISSWEAHADALRWGVRSGFFPSRGAWWWELRPHPSHGTLEFRVPDAQSGLTEAGAVAALVQSLVAWLGDRYDAGEALTAHDTWRIEENRWSACRHGVEGEMADLSSGLRRSTRDCIEELVDELEPTAARLGAAAELRAARRLGARNGAIAQREAAQDGLAALLEWLCGRFLLPSGG